MRTISRSDERAGNDRVNARTRVDDLLGRDRMSLAIVDLLLEISDSVRGLSIEVECLLLYGLERQLHLGG